MGHCQVAFENYDAGCETSDHTVAIFFISYEIDLAGLQFYIFPLRG